MQGVREGSVFTAYRESAAYDEANLRFRYLAGLEDEREPAYAHYFFYKEVAIQIIATLQCTYYCLVNIFECFFSLNRNIRSTLISPQEPA